MLKSGSFKNYRKLTNENQNPLKECKREIMSNENILQETKEQWKNAKRIPPSTKPKPKSVEKIVIPEDIELQGLFDKKSGASILSGSIEGMKNRVSPISFDGTQKRLSSAELVKKAASEKVAESLKSVIYSEKTKPFEEVSFVIPLRKTKNGGKENTAKNEVRNQASNVSQEINSLDVISLNDLAIRGTEESVESVRETKLVGSQRFSTSSKINHKKVSENTSEGIINPSFTQRNITTEIVKETKARISAPEIDNNVGNRIYSYSPAQVKKVNMASVTTQNKDMMLLLWLLMSLEAEYPAEFFESLIRGKEISDVFKQHLSENSIKLVQEMYHQ